MVKVLILFGIPEDAGKFDEYFEETHRALLNALPGVYQLIINRVAGVAVGDLPYYLIVEIHFQSEQQMQSSLNSEPGQAMARDYSKFATGGTTVLICQSHSMFIKRVFDGCKSNLE
jgi:uncharacterized protein (TIGR02118 family)